MASLYTDEQIDRYLWYFDLPPRFDCEKTPKIDVGYLNALHTHWMSTIFYENLSIHYSKDPKVSLDPQMIYGKEYGRSRSRRILQYLDSLGCHFPIVTGLEAAGTWGGASFAIVYSDLIDSLLDFAVFGNADSWSSSGKHDLFHQCPPRSWVLGLRHWRTSPITRQRHPSRWHCRLVPSSPLLLSSQILHSSYWDVLRGAYGQHRDPLLQPQIHGRRLFRRRWSNSTSAVGKEYHNHERWHSGATSDLRHHLPAK